VSTSQPHPPLRGAVQDLETTEGLEAMRLGALFVSRIVAIVSRA
jgi:hypothetical protein